MRFKLWALGIIFGLNQAHAGPAEEAFQKDIDGAIQEIVLTKVGQAICQKILGADPEAIEFHLGVSKAASQTIAQSCGGTPDLRWLSVAAIQDVRKFSPNSRPRKYALVSADNKFPIESWTDPITNTTVFLAGREGITHERLVQLLAHENGVYFDSKTNPAHADAQSVPELASLDIKNAGLMNPLVAVSDPLIAHTLTYVRALQVEYAIVDELIAMRKILPPADHDDPYLKYLVSDKCREICLEKLIARMRTDYLPIALPLLAFSSHYRAMVIPELARVRPLWLKSQGARVQDALYTLPNEFYDKQFTGKPLEDLQRIFRNSPWPTAEFQTVTKFLDDIWYVEQPALVSTTVKGQPFLEFMKVPLLSGYNILLSSGPRVRVRTGGVE